MRATSWWLAPLLVASVWSAPLAGAGPEEPPAEETPAEQASPSPDEPGEPPEEETATSSAAMSEQEPLDGEEIGAEHVPGEVIVKYGSGVGASKRAEVLTRVGARLQARLALPRVELARTGKNRSVAETITELESRPEVEYAEPNYIYRLTQTFPDDTLFSSLWGLHNTGQSGGTVDADIDAPEAWSVSTGSTDVLVAVADTGVEQSHPDIPTLHPASKAWVNLSDGPMVDKNGHGTHVAGTIGALGNNGTGVTGVAWEVSIVSLKVLNTQGSGTLANIADAFTHAGEQGVHIVNGSFGGSGGSSTLSAAITGASDTLFVFAAGNDGLNNDAWSFYPCNYSFDNVICVAASDRNDNRPSWSNYGKTKVHLAAPGASIRSTWKPSSTTSATYRTISGTSMAAPHVAGAAALVKSAFPEADVADIREALLASVDPMFWGATTTATGGRLNVARALEDLEVIAAITPAVTTSPRYQKVIAFPVSWEAPGAPSSFDVRYREARWNAGFGSPVEWRTGIPETEDEFDQGRTGSTYCFSARGHDDETTSPWSKDECTSTPLNNTQLVHRKKWAKKKGDGYYRNSYSQTRTRGSRLIRSGVRAKRLAIVATRCGTCGTIDVFWGKNRLKRINLSKGAGGRSQIIPVKTFNRVRKGRVRIRVVTRKRLVRIEGLGISKL